MVLNLKKIFICATTVAKKKLKGDFLKLRDNLSKIESISLPQMTAWNYQ